MKRCVMVAMLAIVLPGVLAPAVRAADAPRERREIIPGSELMTSAERERYRQRLRGAKSDDEHRKLRGEHVGAMQERARLRGLELRDPNAARGTK